MPTSLDKSKPKAKASARTLDPDDVRMSFGDHLEELRARLILSLIGVTVAALVTFIFGREIIAWLQLPLHRAQVVLGMSPGTVTTGVTAPFSIYMKVSMLAALVVALPWVVYQLWKFVAAGLYAHERQVVYLLAPFSTAMMALGVLFMYYVMLPVCLAFFLSFAVSYPEAGGQEPNFMDRMTQLLQWDALVGDANPGDSGAAADPTAAGATASADPALWQLPTHNGPRADAAVGQMWWDTRDNTLRLQTPKGVMVFRPETTGSVHPLITLPEYINFVMYLTVGIMAGFQLPVLMTVAGWTGVIDPKVLAASRKYALFIICAVAAVLTPADPLSMMVLAAPMYLLFEFGLLLMRQTYRAPEGEDA